MGLVEAVQTLYALPPAEFLTRRTELVAAARGAKDRALAKEVGALRRPTVSAWAINQLSRARADDVTRLVALGDRLRQAQAAADGTALRELGRERSALLDELAAAAAQAAADAGAELSAAVDREVRETLSAALASVAAAEAVTGGGLTRALSYSGFGEVDLTEATAPTPVRRPRPERGDAAEPVADPDGGDEAAPDDATAAEPTEKDRAQVQADRERAERLAGAEAAARESAEAAATAAAAATEAALAQQRLQAEVEQLQEQLDDAVERLSAATAERSRASRAQRDAERHAREATAELEQAQGT